MTAMIVVKTGNKFKKMLANEGPKFETDLFQKISPITDGKIPRYNNPAMPL